MSKNRSFAIAILILIVLAGLALILSPVRETRQRDLYEVIARGAALRIYSTDYPTCTTLISDNRLIPEGFVLAVVAVENYGRPPFRRWLEDLLARTSLTVLGHIPDLSLGVGQVKLSTARRLLHDNTKTVPFPPVPDSEILAKLLDPCENIGIVRQYLNFLIQESKFGLFDESAAMEILKQYNGQQSTKNRDGMYQRIVWKVYRDYFQFSHP